MNENSNQRLVVPADRLDIKDLFLKVLRRWPFILAGGAIGIIIAFSLNRYIRDTYQLEAVLNVEQVENPLARSGVSLVVNTFGENKLDVKELVLKSVELNKMAARKLNWEVKYYQSGRLTKIELYENTPVRVEFDKNHYQITNIPFYIEDAGDEYLISTEAVGFTSKVYDYQKEQEVRVDSAYYPEGKYRYGEWIQANGYRFRLHRKADFNLR